MSQGPAQKMLTSHAAPCRAVGARRVEGPRAPSADRPDPLGRSHTCLPLGRWRLASHTPGRACAPPRPDPPAPLAWGLWRGAGPTPRLSWSALGPETWVSELWLKRSCLQGPLCSPRLGSEPCPVRGVAGRPLPWDRRKRPSGRVSRCQLLAPPSASAPRTPRVACLGCCLQHPGLRVRFRHGSRVSGGAELVPV